MIQDSLFSQAEINDLSLQEFDRNEYIVDALKLPAIAAAIRRAGKVGFDVETSSFARDASLVGIGLAWYEDANLKSVYIPTGHVTTVPQIRQQLVLDWLSDLFKDVLVIPFNAAFELRIAKRFRIFMDHFDDSRYYAVADNEGRARDSLKDIGEKEFGIRWGTLKEVCSRRVKERNEKGRMVSRIILDVPGTSIEKLGRYCRTDAEVALRVYDKFVQTTKYATNILALERKVTPVVVEMEDRGIRIDVVATRQKLQETKDKLEDLERQIIEAAGKPINLNSPLQVSGLLFDDLNLRTIKGRSVDVNVLQELKAHPIPKMMLEYRELEKIRGTYLEPLLERQRNGRIYTSLNQLGTETGRFSSNSPNMQNIPVDSSIRSLFIASEGMLLLDYDYSQIEGRVFAHASQDKTLLEYYRNDGDIHTATSEKLGIPRKLAKVINFAIIYGAGPRQLSTSMQKEGFTYSEDDARDMIRGFWKTYRGGAKWAEGIKAQAHREKQVFTVFGRRRIFPDIDQLDRYQMFSAEREAVNFVIQGTAADVIKYALVDVYAKLKAAGFPAHPILTVHDELLFEGSEANLEYADPIIKDSMQNAVSLSLPLLVEGKKGLNWAEVH